MNPTLRLATGLLCLTVALPAFADLADNAFRALCAGQDPRLHHLYL